MRMCHIMGSTRPQRMYILYRQRTAQADSSTRAAPHSRVAPPHLWLRRRQRTRSKDSRYKQARADAAHRTYHTTLVHSHPSRRELRWELADSASPYATSLDGANRLLVSDDIRHNNHEIAVPHHLQVLDLSAQRHCDGLRELTYATPLIIASVCDNAVAVEWPAKTKRRSPQKPSSAAATRLTHARYFASSRPYEGDEIGKQFRWMSHPNVFCTLTSGCSPRGINNAVTPQRAARRRYTDFESARVSRSSDLRLLAA